METPPTFEKLPPAEEQDALLQALRELIDRAGPGSFLGNPVLTPTPEHFPDTWTPDVLGAQTMLRRLLAYAGLTDVEVVLEAAVPSGPHVAAWFLGFEGRRCLFGVNVQFLGHPELLAGALAHEAAHAWRAHRGLEKADDDRLEELCTDLTTMYLGFGVLTANAAFLSRSGGYLQGATAYHSFSVGQLGYLSPQSFSFALAVQCLARGGEPADVRRALERTQADSFDAALTQLGQTRAELRQRLGLSDGVAPYAPNAPTTLPRAGEVFAPQRVKPTERNRGQPVFRLRTHRAFQGSVWSFAMCIPAMFLMAKLDSPLPFCLMPLIVVAGWLMRREICSDASCSAELAVDTVLCPGCGGIVAGSIRRPIEKYDAETAWRRARGLTAEREDLED